MSRGLTAGQIAALAESNIRYLILAEMEFATTVRFHTGLGDLTYDGNIYSGVGNFAEISVLDEGHELQSYGFTLGMSGVDGSLVAIAMNEHYQGRPARIYIALLDNDHQIIDVPIGPWEGLMDTMDGEFGETAKIVLSVESRLIDWERARIRRYNNADQQIVYPNDKGLEFVEQMVEKELVWGRS